MSGIRCARCGRFALLGAGVEIPANAEVLCHRCYAVTALSDTCYEEVAGRNGTAQPCERPAYGVRIDPESLAGYPVCRQHYRPPFELCDWRHGDRSYCVEHDAPWPMGEAWCDLAFEVAP